MIPEHQQELGHAEGAEAVNPEKKKGAEAVNPGGQSLMPQPLSEPYVRALWQSLMPEP